MATELTEAMVATIKSAARKLTGFARRQFQAETAIGYCGGSPRLAETIFGWGRDTVNTGVNEWRTGIRCLDNFHARGRHRSEDKDAALIHDLRAIVEPASQADPKFQTPLAYTRITAAAVHRQLAAVVAGTDRPLPSERTVYDLLHRLGYRLRRVRKTAPQKKSPRPTPSSNISKPFTPAATPSRKRCASRSTPKRKSRSARSRVAA
jgi:transposase